MKRHDIRVSCRMGRQTFRWAVAAICAIVALPAAAQEPVGTFSLMPKVGLSLASISNYELYYFKDAAFLSEGVAKGKFNSRFMGGIEAEYQALPMASFSLGVYYSQQGCRVSDIELNLGPGQYEGIDDIRQSLDYINVPLTASLYVTQGLAVKAGVQMGFLLNSKLSYDVTSFARKEGGANEYGQEVHEESDTKWMRRTLDVSIPIGLSYEYSNVVLDARYHLGLTRLYKEDGYPKEKNRLITISVGYKFNL